MINASNYVCANPIGDLVLTRGPSGAVLDRASTVLSEIERRCGTDVAALFAQPTLKSATENTVVSWYAAPSGSPRPLAELDEIGRRPFDEILRARLGRLVPLMGDPDIGADIGAALNIRSFADIYVVGRDPVVVNWGLLPRDVAASEPAREIHFRKTLGAFLPDVPTPPADLNGSRAFTEAMARWGRASDARARSSAAATAEPAPDLPPRAVGAVAVHDRHWVAPLVASVLAAAALGVLLIPGVLGFATVVSPDQAAVDHQARALQDVNKSLEKQIADLKAQSGFLACRALPGAKDVTLAPPNLLPPAPQNVPVTPPVPGGPTNAAELADQAVVLVRASHGFGSGFFISDSLIVTNEHVIDDHGATVSPVTVENKTLGRRVPATVIARTHRHAGDPDDFALLRVDTGTSKAFLKVATQPAKTTAVRSIGFPGIVVHFDDSPIPESSIVDGNVSSFIDMGGQNIIVHTATIFPGNSGGPLVDLCSRAVGVNTEFGAAKDVPGAVYLAQTTDSLLAFLKSNGQDVTADATPCAPPPVAFGNLQKAK